MFSFIIFFNFLVRTCLQEGVFLDLVFDFELSYFNYAKYIHLETYCLHTNDCITVDLCCIHIDFRTTIGNWHRYWQLARLLAIGVWRLAWLVRKHISSN